MRAIFSTATLTAILLAGCAHGGANHDPIIDGPYTANYEQDLLQCREVAKRRSYGNSDVQTAALVGAGIGALVGLLNNDPYRHYRRGRHHRKNNDGEDALVGAAIGAVAGGGSEALKTRGQRREILLNCLAGRGYRVLG